MNDFILTRQQWRGVEDSLFVVTTSTMFDIIPRHPKFHIVTTLGALSNILAQHIATNWTLLSKIRGTLVQSYRWPIPPLCSNSRFTSTDFYTRTTSIVWRITNCHRWFVTATSYTYKNRADWKPQHMEYVMNDCRASWISMNHGNRRNSAKYSYKQ